MTERISLVEAYDNRDVIAQLVRLRDNVDELLNILKDIDPNGDLTNVVTKTGDQTIDGVKTFIGQIVADCDIIQNGAAYETHAEQVFSVNDYIVTRDGQITGLAPGDLSGFHVKKYNGVDDSRLGVDNTGTMRVGDVGSEQPLATRDEAADMVSGAYVRWDGVNQKLIAPDVDTGDDTHPVKFVDGAPVAVSAALGTVNEVQTGSQGSISVTANVVQHGLGPITVASAGTYLIQIGTGFSAGADGYIRIGASKNGAVLTEIQNNYVHGSGTFYTSGVTVATLAVGDVVGVSFIAGVGGTLGVSTAIVKLK